MTQQMSIFNYPVPAQASDTSRAAAKDMEPRVTGLRAAVLAALRDRPMATFELSRAIGKTYRSIQPRTSELRKLGKIEDSGARRMDPETGKQTIVWRIAA